MAMRMMQDMGMSMSERGGPVCTDSVHPPTHTLTHLAMRIMMHGMRVITSERRTAKRHVLPSAPVDCDGDCDDYDE